MNTNAKMAHIPSELKQRPQWVCWKREMRDGKQTKVPYIADTGECRASSTNPATWRTFEEACRHAARFDGIGFVFAADDPYCGIDLDHAIDPDTGEVHPDALEILRGFPSYTELSPSGTGLHIICRAELPGRGTRKRCGDIEVEMYDRGRYFTITGRAWGDDRLTPEIRDCSDAVLRLYAQLGKPGEPRQDDPETSPAPVVVNLSDADLLARARLAGNRVGAKLIDLFDHGDPSAYDGDESRADFTLCEILNFWTGNDFARTERLARQSALVRPKWDERRGDETYLAYTIRNARSKNVYTPGRRKLTAEPDEPEDLEPTGTHVSEDPDGLEPGKELSAGATPAQQKAEDRATFLLRRILDGKEGQATLCVAPDQTTYIRLDAPTRSVAWPIRSTSFRQFLRKRFFELRNSTLREDDLKRAVEHLDAQAACDGQHQEAYLRVAPGQENDYYIDLRNDAFEMIHVTADGWDIVRSAPVLFRRGRNSRPMLHPERGGRFDVMRKYLNVEDGEWVLLASCLASYMSPVGPYPHLSFAGAQGSGKSTACRIIKKLIDPATVELYSPPENPRDVFVAAQNNWLIAYENLSGIPAWLSDVFSRLATGSGMSARELYTDSEEKAIQAQRPIVTNGIPDILTKPDLMDRAIALILKPLPVFKTESEFYKAVERDLPTAFGGLLDACCEALKNSGSTITDPTARMADFARWGAAASSGFGWTPGMFLSIYQTSRATAQEDLIEADPVSTRLLEMMEGREVWVGTATELFEAIAPVPLPRLWPQTARALSQHMRRYERELAAQGLKIDKIRDNQRRLFRIGHTDAREASEPVTQTGDANPQFASPEDPFASPDEARTRSTVTQVTEMTQKSPYLTTSQNCGEREKGAGERREVQSAEDFASLASFPSPCPDDDPHRHRGGDVGKSLLDSLRQRSHTTALTPDGGVSHPGPASAMPEIPAHQDASKAEPRAEASATGGAPANPGVAPGPPHTTARTGRAVGAAHPDSSQLLPMPADVRRGRDVWTDETRELIAWFEAARERLPAEPFDLCPHLHVGEPAQFYGFLRDWIADGDNGPHPGLTDKLRQLREVVTSTQDGS